MTAWALRKEWVLVTSPELTRRAEERRFPGSREIPSAVSSSSALEERRRRVVGGIVWLCRQIFSTASSPYACVHRSTSQMGWAYAVAMACGETSLNTESTAEH